LLVAADHLGSWQRIGEHPMSKDRSLGLRIDADLEERIKAAASKERRPAAQWVRNALIDAVSKSSAKEQAHG
jgi:hypothetical protein